MATNCDYCHKPLSLMRRLRGEQFCSVEHLDQYSAQQAEFALERLAASVTEKPNTERPPALPKSTPKLRPIATPAANPEPQTAVALQEREPHVTTEELAPAARTAFEPDYPMAPYLAQTAIEPREFETVEDHLAGFSLSETWGKASPAWSMPAFHSEPSDVRTWKAGKLASGIPPAAGWRELLGVKAPEPMELLSDADAELPHLEIGVARLRNSYTASEIQDVFPARLTQYRALLVQPGSIEVLIQSEYAAEYAAGQPLFTNMGEAIQAGFRLVENRLEQAARVRTEIRAQASSFTFDEASGPQFALTDPTLSNVALAGAAISILRFATPQMPGLGLVAKQLDLGTPEGPTPPESSYALPQPTGWNWTPTFAVPQVAMPEVQPRQLLNPISASETSSGWEELPGTVQSPVARWFAPHFSHTGPTFGWEDSQPKPWLDTPRVDGEPVRFANVDTFGGSPRIKDFRLQVNAGLESSGQRPRQGWSVPRTDAVKFEVGPLVTLRPTLTALDIQVRPLLPYKQARLEAASSPSYQLSLQPGQRPAAATPAPAMEASQSGPSISHRLAIPGPAPALGRYGSASPVALADHEISGIVRQTGPVRYSPVAIVVMPPSQFALAPAALADEQRYVAQSPNGVWRLPRVRHTGYRALGPFPKLPLRMPDRYLQASTPVMHPAFQEVPRIRIEKRQDLSGLPVLARPEATRIHPADYLAWPQPKGMNSARILPENEYQQAGRSTPGAVATVRRFGPGRAGLQSKNRSADGHAKGRGLR